MSIIELDFESKDEPFATQCRAFALLSQFVDLAVDAERRRQAELILGNLIAVHQAMCDAEGK